MRTFPRTRILLLLFIQLFQRNSASGLTFYDICTENDVTGSGLIVTPNKLTQTFAYAPNLNCQISISTGNADTGSVKLRFRQFDVDFDVSGDCFDTLTIDGKDYCGVYDELELCFVTPSLQLSFRSDDYADSNDFHSGFSIEFVTSPSNQCECLTESGEGETAQVCMFPFTYQGVTYHQCAGDVRQGEKPFCATQVDQNGTLSDDANKKSCDMSIEACKQKCLSTEGKQCLLPYPHHEIPININTCAAKLESDETASCPTQRGRIEDGGIKTIFFGTCQMDACQVLDTCSTESSAVDGQLISSNSSFIFDSTYAYSTGASCRFKYLSESSYYRFTFYKLDVHCQDAVQLIDSSSGAFKYNLCSKTSEPDYDGIQICLPTSNVEVLFETGSTNAESTIQRAGFLAAFEQIDQSKCAITDEDTACYDPKGRLVTSEETIRSKFYPLPYPANSSCVWNIETPSDNLAVNVSVKNLDLGVIQDEFSVTDLINVSDASSRSLVYLPGPQQDTYPWFLSVPGGAMVQFNSGHLFNYHQNFELDVSFVEFVDHLELYVDAGLCVSRETPDVCQIPFKYLDNEYKVCDYLEVSDDKPSCISYTGNKVVCDESIVACGRQFPHFTSYDVGYTDINDTTNQLTLSWTVANKFWDYFQIYVNGEIYRDLFPNTTVSENIPSNETDIRIEIIVFGYIESPKSLHLTLYPEKLVQTSSFDDFASVSLKWPQGAYENLEGLLNDDSIQNFATFAQSVGITAPLGITNIEQMTEYTINDLSAGVTYKFSFTGNEAENILFTIPPNPIQSFQVSAQLEGSGPFTVSGTLSKETICMEIVFEIVTQGPATDPISRKRRQVEESFVVCSFENGCIDADGNFNADLTSAMSEPGTCYVITALSLSNGVESESTSESTSFCTPFTDGTNGTDIVPPKPVFYSTSSIHSINRVSVGFEVHPTVSSFDYVILYFYDSSTETFGPEGYICKGTEPFQAGIDSLHECEIPGLRSNMEYVIALKGHDPEKEINGHDGLSAMSQNLTILQDSPFYLHCQPDSYDVYFPLSWITTPPSPSAFVKTTIQSSDSGTAFDEQEFIQNEWNDVNVFIPPESLPVFRGFPESIHVQSDSQAITALFSNYTFADGSFKINGNEATFDESLSKKFDLQTLKARVTFVRGSFNDKYLTSIQVGWVHDNGEDMGMSECYGVGPCSGFELNQTRSNQFVVGFAGKVEDTTGYITELTLNWVTVAEDKYYLGTETCPPTEEVNWYNYEDSAYHFHVDNLNQCQTTRTVVGGSQTVVYENRITRQSALSMTQDANTDTLGSGNMTASRIWSMGGVIIQCIYEADGIVSGRFETSPQEDTETVSETTSVQFQMLFYSDESFTTPINSNGEIVTVNSGENIYFGVSFAEGFNYDMTVYAYTCYAKKTDNPEMAADGSNFLLLKSDGCPASDETFERYSDVKSGTNDKIDPMSIQAFHWFNDYTSVVHIHCKVRACVPDNQDNCIPPTSCSRARRGVKLYDSDRESFVTSQPIRVEGSRRMFVQPLEKQLTVSWFWVPLSVLCGVSITFLLIMVNRLRKRRANSVKYQKIPTTS